MHPMRAVMLSAALAGDLWGTVPSFFGRRVTGTAYEQSKTVARCDYFVSHSWSDDGARKVAMLREFLCLQTLLGRLLVVAPMMAFAMAAPGFALASISGSLPWWTISAVPMAVVLLIITWVLLATMEAIPSCYAPWALSRGTLWIEWAARDSSPRPMPLHPLQPLTLHRSRT